jgi:PAS domain S-box-containing protein
VFFLYNIYSSDKKLISELYEQRLIDIHQKYERNRKKLIKNRFKIIENFIDKHKSELAYAVFTVEKEYVIEILKDLLNFPSIKKVMIFDGLSGRKFVSATKDLNNNIIFNSNDKFNVSEHLKEYKTPLSYKELNKKVGYLIFYYDVTPIIQHLNKLKEESIKSLQISYEQANDRIKNNFKKRALFFTLMFLALFIVIYFLFEVIIYLPLNKLETSLQSFFDFLSKKKDEFKLININTNDEFGRMSKFINEGINVSVKIHKDLENLAKELNKLATVIEQAPQAIIITDLGGNVEYANNSYKKLLGKFENFKDVNIFKEIDDENTVENILDTVNSGNIWYGTLESQNKNGIIYERVCIFPIKNSSGDTINFAIIKNDITEEKKLEEQLMQSQKMEVIGRLAGGIAHDFNNILTVINGFAELTLLQYEEDNNITENINNILEAGKRAQKLTRNLLTLSRKQVHNPKLLDVNKLLINLKSMFNRLITKDIKVVMNLKKDIPKIKIDESQLEQILLNLLVNSRDALANVDRDKCIWIKTDTFEISSKDDENFYRAKRGRYVLISVADNGSGMDEQTKRKIFEPFFTTKEQGRGTGLGLSIVYNIVKQNNGFIYLYSQLDKGTTFDIFFPVSTIKQFYETYEKKDNNIVKGNETILVVEDEQDVLNFLEKTLTSLGYKIMTASNGLDAFNIFENKSEKIDLVITDIIMPNINGKSLYKKITQMNKNIKVIFISGNIDEIEKNSDLDNIKILHKPFTIINLSKVIREVLD